MKKELDIDNKWRNYSKISGFINNAFMPLRTLNITRIKLNNTLHPCSFVVRPWKLDRRIGARDARRLTAAEMKFMRRTAVYTWTDYKTNAEIAKELNITPDLGKMQDYRSNWTRCVSWMSFYRLPRIIENYKPKDRKKQGRPLKRLLDVWDQNGPTSGPTRWYVHDDDDDADDYDGYC